MPQPSRQFALAAAASILALAALALFPPAAGGGSSSGPGLLSAMADLPGAPLHLPLIGPAS